MEESYDMSAQLYWYFVPYDGDVAGALARLRQREFEAGRYNPRLRRIDFDEPAFSAQTPGPGHPSIAKAIAASFDVGTRSILDIDRIAATPAHGAACPLSDAQCQATFGTRTPTREAVLASRDWFDDIERGQCVVVTIFADDLPSELLFAGVSYD